MPQQPKRAELTPMRTTISLLLVGAALTIGSTTATAYAARCAAACERDCDWAGRFDRCMRRCVEDCSWRSVPAAKPYVPRSKHARPPWLRPFAELVELFLRFLPEVFGGILGTVFLMLRAIKRRRNLRISNGLNCRATALERKAVDLRAEAFRRMHDS